MIRFRLALGFASLFAVLLGTGANAQVVYSNGPLNGTIDGFAISDDGGFGSQAITNSFTVSSPTPLAMVTAGIWNDPGDTTSTINWAIGSTQFGSDISSGTSTTTDAFQFTTAIPGGLTYNIYEDSFAVSGTVTPGTYWLTLFGAIATGGDPTFWDLNNGPSLGFYQNGVSNGTLNGQIVPGTNSESFTIYDSALPGTPEPGGWAMLAGMGLSALAVARRRRRG